MSEKTRGIHLLVIFVFLLFCMPRLNVRLGPVPLYAIDVIAALMLYQFSISSRKFGTSIALPFRGIIMVIGFFVILSEVSAFVYDGSILDATYLSVRYFLAFGTAFVIPHLIRTRADIEVVLKAAALALVITSVLMITSSLPMTRALPILLFSIPNLDPSNAGRFLIDAGDSGIRGTTLIGVSILSGAFISIGWPLAAYLRTARFKLSAFWEIVSLAAVTLSPLGIVMSYSRQAATGAILVILATLIYKFGDLRSRILRPVLFSVAIVAFVGAGSSLFFFDRFTNRFSAVIDTPLADDRESARFLSYVVPFEHVVDNPQFFLVGAGSRREESSSATIKSFEENHSLIGAGYFAHGMVSTLLMAFLVFAVLRYTNWYRKQSDGLPERARGWSRALFLGYLPFLPMAAFSPGLGNNLRCMYIFMLFIGLLTTLRNGALTASLEGESPAETMPPTAGAGSRRGQTGSIPQRNRAWTDGPDTPGWIREI